VFVESLMFWTAFVRSIGRTVLRFHLFQSGKLNNVLKVNKDTISTVYTDISIVLV